MGWIVLSSEFSPCEVKGSQWFLLASAARWWEAGGHGEGGCSGYPCTTLVKRGQGALLLDIVVELDGEAVILENGRRASTA